MSEKKQDFVVTDRRRFAPEGALRTETPDTEAPAIEEEKAAPAPPAASATQAPPDQAPTTSQAKQEQTAASDQPEQEELPPPPTAVEQQEQTEAYKVSRKKLDDLVGQSQGARTNLPEMTFERLIESFYMTALLQLGAIRQEGEPVGVDIMGARQTIDSLTIIQEKTKGNLADREQALLQNVLFELRMAWIEVTNALAGAAAKPGAGPIPGKK
jgi:hypothetical protein